MASLLGRILDVLRGRSTASYASGPDAEELRRRIERGEGARPSAALESVLRAATELAAAANRLVTVEHLLLGLVRDADVRALLARLGADAAHVESELLEYLDLLDEAPAARAGQATPSAQRVLGIAFWQSSASGAAEVTPRDLLPPITAADSDDDYAAKLLYAEGLSRLALLRQLAHGDAPPSPIPAAPRLRVILHNDDYTTMEFVVEVLREIFHRPEKDAVALMLDVHRRGRAVVGDYPRAEALDLVAEVTARAERADFPLRCTLEAA